MRIITCSLVHCSFDSSTRFLIVAAFIRKMKATFFYTQTQESNANSLIELGEEVLSQKSFAKAIIASGSFLDAQQ